MGGSSIRLDTVSNPPKAVLLVRGEVDASTGPDFAAAVESLPKTITVVELDLTEVTFIDSTALGVIASLVHTMETRGGRVSVRNPSVMVLRLLTITDLLRFVTVVDDR